MGSTSSSNLTNKNLPPDFPSDIVLYELKNLTNTCFCNSVLQTFLFSKYISSYFDYLATIKFPKEFVNTPLYQFLQIYKKKNQLISSTSNTRVIRISPSDFAESFYHETNQFIRYQQNDAHEFLLYLISSFDNTILKLKSIYCDKKNDELQKKQDEKTITEKIAKQIKTNINTEENNIDSENVNTKVHENDNEQSNNNDEKNIKNMKIPLFSLLFEGTRSSSFECAYCHHTQDKIEKFTYMDIGITDDNSGKELDLQGLIDISLDPDKICEDEGGWVCSNCNEKGINIEITTYIKELPWVLLIQLQRFKYNKATRVMEKNSKYVKIQNEIHLNSGGGPQTYKLKSIICHRDHTLHQGHFVSLHRVPREKIKNANNIQPNEDLPKSDDYWIFISDDVIKLTNQDTIDSIIKGITRDGAYSTPYTPYVMLYECSE